MALRLIEMIVPEGSEGRAEELLKEDDKVLDFWCEDVHEEKKLMKILVDAEKSQTVIDKLKENFGLYDEFRILMFSVEASVPVEDGKKKKEEEGDEEEEKKEEGKETKGVSREEIYTDVLDQCQLSRVFILLMVLSSIVAAIGVVKNEVAVIVGAMVIAPILGPNVGLSLSTTLADSKLARKSIKTSIVGIVLAMAISMALGLVLSVDTTTPQLASRTDIGLLQVVLALASGSAGALAYTKGLSSAVIGVMVSLALVPALVTSGLLFGSGYFILGSNAFILFLINLICVNLSGVLTFIAQGFEPSSWWEVDKARRMRAKAIVLWITLLIILIAGIIYIEYF